jgi:hypothetical protein
MPTKPHSLGRPHHRKHHGNNSQSHSPKSIPHQSTRQDLIAPDLFGNDAGDDEAPEILNSYFLDKPEFQPFFSPSTRLAFARSRKGVGKSALLKQTLNRRKQSGGDELLIYLKASDLIALQDIASQSPGELVYGWQQRICTQINLEIGSTLKLGFNDESMLLIESAELAGFRNRNIVSALFDRLKIKGLGPDIERTRLTAPDSQSLLTRVLENKGMTVWLFVDDVDATFLNTEHERLKASTFFSACRNLVSSVQGLCLRAAVRTDVWTVLAQYDEALDKCEQYMLDLQWSTAESGRILENKIHSYFSRYYPEDTAFSSLAPGLDGDRIRRMIFKEPFPWGAGRQLESFRPIHILSAGRPRWASQLCKLAGRNAFENTASHISIGHIRAIMRPYGQLRINDLYKEHRHQCQALQDIVEAFSGGPHRYTTQELLNHIADKVIKRIGTPRIDGITVEAGSLSIAHFLYRVGFIAARDETDSAGLGFIQFEARPNLLTSKANLDDGLPWEIHPSYRQVLRIQHSRTAGDSDF